MDNQELQRHCNRVVTFLDDQNLGLSPTDITDICLTCAAAMSLALDLTGNEASQMLKVSTEGGLN